MNEIHDLSSIYFKTYLVSISSVPELVPGAREEKVSETESLLQEENMQRQVSLEYSGVHSQYPAEINKEALFYNYHGMVHRLLLE